MGFVQALPHQRLEDQVSHPRGRNTLELVRIEAVEVPKRGQNQVAATRRIRVDVIEVMETGWILGCVAERHGRRRKHAGQIRGYQEQRYKKQQAMASVAPPRAHPRHVRSRHFVYHCLWIRYHSLASAARLPKMFSRNDQESKMGFLTGKRALVVGVASERSIAWGIAEAMHREGAEIAYTYQNERLQSRVEKCAQQTNSKIVLPCDVANDSEIDAVFDGIAKHWDGLDSIVHAVGYAPLELLAGYYLDTVTRDGFQIAHDISSYSFAALAKARRPL